jgi:hypothetical protein
VYMKPELAKVGPAWEGGNIEKWPGVAGVAGQTNHLAQNLDPFLPDPENTSSMRGGKRRYRRSYKKRRHTKSKRRHTKSKRRHTKSKRRHNKKTRKYRGGSGHGNTLMPQPLVNLGRNIRYNAESNWSSFTGGQQPVNPDPLIQPIGM